MEHYTEGSTFRSPWAKDVYINSAALLHRVPPICILGEVCGHEVNSEQFP
jgi:hypothetical protein